MANRLKILQITDLHLKANPQDTMLGVETERHFLLTLQHAHQQHGPFDLMLLTGDLAQDPCPASYQRLYRLLEPYRTRCLCLPGNHDDLSLMEQYLNEDLVGCDKVLQLGNWRILALNSQKPGSPVGELAEIELCFLQEALQSGPEQSPVLIALHHNCIASGSAWLDTMQIQNSTAFLDLVKTFPQVKAIVFGHVHQELNSRLDHIAIFGTPASCFQFEPHSKEFSIDDKPPAYRILQLSADGSLHSACHSVPIDMGHLQRSTQAY